MMALDGNLLRGREGGCGNVLDNGQVTPLIRRLSGGSWKRANQDQDQDQL